MVRKIPFFMLTLSKHKIPFYISRLKSQRESRARDFPTLVDNRRFVCFA